MVKSILAKRSFLTPGLLGPDLLGTVRSDLLAGVTVAAISLPQSIAYALIAGVDPRFGLYTAIVFTAIAGLLGSSRHLVNGPTGAVSLLVFTALAFLDPEQKFDAYEAMALLAVMMGIVQIGIAVFKLGDLTRYISESVVTGFITGAAFLTMIGQVANALGIKSLGTGNQHVLYRLYLTVTQSAAFNIKAIVISLGGVALTLLVRRLVRRYRLPQLDMLFVLIILAGGAYLAGWSQAAPGAKPAISLIETVPAHLPPFHIPDLKLSWLADLSSSALSIGILGLLEALAIAKAIAHKSGQNLDYNRQCLAEGVGNLVGGFFSCMPGAGSLSRTAINYQAGALTRFSGVFTALVVAIAVLLLAPLTAYIPKAALAGLLLVAAARLIDPVRIAYTLRGSLHDSVLLLVTAISAVAIGVEFAILIGVVLSVLFYIPRASRLQVRELVVTPERVVRERLPSDPASQGVLIYDIEGELFFGAAPDLEAALNKARQKAREEGITSIVLRFKRVRNPDMVALERLEIFLRDAREDGVSVFLAGVRPDLLAALTRLDILAHHPESLLFVEEEEEFSSTLKAIRAAYAPFKQQRQESGQAEGELAYYLV